MSRISGTSFFKFTESEKQEIFNNLKHTIMAYKWRPSASQRRAFAERMKDPAEQAAYLERKEDRAAKRRASSAYNYSSAGGNYIATKSQHDAAMIALQSLQLTPEQRDACHQVTYSFSCQEKIHHDYIHIVNELRRSHLTLDA